MSQCGDYRAIDGTISISRARRYRGRPMADGLGPRDEPWPRDPDDPDWFGDEADLELPAMLGEAEPLV